MAGAVRSLRFAWDGGVSWGAGISGQTQRVEKGWPPDGRLCWAIKAFIGG